MSLYAIARHGSVYSGMRGERIKASRKGVRPVSLDDYIGTLVYMAANGKILLTSADYYQLKKNKDARNQLSHLNTLTIDEIRELIG